MIKYLFSNIDKVNGFTLPYGMHTKVDLENKLIIIDNDSGNNRI